MKQKPAELYRKLQVGESFTDMEVEQGRIHFGTLAEMLYESGPEFRITAKECHWVYDKFDSMQSERQRET